MCGRTKRESSFSRFPAHIRTPDRHARTWGRSERSGISSARSAGARTPAARFGRVRGTRIRTSRIRRPLRPARVAAGFAQRVLKVRQRLLVFFDVLLLCSDLALAFVHIFTAILLL